jgi:hypothetical protein
MKIAKKIASVIKLERMKYIQCYGRNHLPNALPDIHNICDSVSPSSHLLPVHSGLSREYSTQFQRFTTLTFKEMESDTIDFRWFLYTKASKICSGVLFLLSPLTIFLDQG